MRFSVHSHKNLPLVLAALGVVFGDIGTSPLYAMPAALHGLPIISNNVLGVLSLIFWSLILVISTCYMGVFLRADNQGEGGVLALLALLKNYNVRFYSGLFLLGILGAGLLLGDGILTPAISVLSAYEGLEVISPAFADYIVPFSIITLVVLFLCQHFGSGKIGHSFGPIILIWFVTIGTLGVIGIYQNPHVLAAVNPYYAFIFFKEHGWQAYPLLGGVFLVITGAEALYADLGHFGKNPIRFAWYTIALPGLLLNYFGQGAHLLQKPSAIQNPFYDLAPDWFTLPLLILAAMATVIASQAVITASFSLAKQAMLLNLCPRFALKQTSAKKSGQIFIPEINWILTLGTLAVVLFFKRSSDLAGAYGIAVNLVMIIVAILVMTVAMVQWQWSISKIIRVFLVFMIMDLAFLGANIHKILSGGWLPLLFAGCCAVVMITWHSGLEVLHATQRTNKIKLREIARKFNPAKLQYLPDLSAVFITDPQDPSGGIFLNYLSQVGILPEKMLILGVKIAKVPYVPAHRCFEIKKVSANISRLNLNFGFMQTLNVPRALSTGNKKNLLPFVIDLTKVLYLVEMVDVDITGKKQQNLFYWQKKVFKILLRSSAVDIKFFHLPFNRTISLGARYNI